MRLLIDLELTRPATLPVNHGDSLQGVIYRLLGDDDPDYARFLHDEGYPAALAAAPDPETEAPTRSQPTDKLDQRRYKLFVYSGLRAPASRRRIIGDLLHLGAGRVQWAISSPNTKFLNHITNAILSAGALRVGAASLPIAAISATPVPDFAAGRADFTCLTPIVAAVPATDGRSTPRYLRPTEGDAFSEAVRNNLLRKHLAAYGRAPESDALRLTFHAPYLERDTRNHGTKKVTFHNLGIIGALAPFTLEGSPELLALAWQAGLGQHNSGGFGMIDVDSRAPSPAVGMGERG